MFNYMTIRRQTFQSNHHIYRHPFNGLMNTRLSDYNSYYFLAFSALTLLVEHPACNLQGL